MYSFYMLMKFSLFIFIQLLQKSPKYLNFFLYNVTTMQREKIKFYFARRFKKKHEKDRFEKVYFFIQKYNYICLPLKSLQILKQKYINGLIRTNSVYIFFSRFHIFRYDYSCVIWKKNSNNLTTIKGIL